MFWFFRKKLFWVVTNQKNHKQPFFVKFRPWMLILLLLIGTSSVSSDFGDSRTFILSLCFIIFYVFEFDFRDSNSIYGFCYDALCVNIFFYSLLFVNVLLWEWVWKSEVEKNLEMTTHAWDEKCILLLNIWPRIKRKDDCSHPRNKFTWIIGGNHYCWSNHIIFFENCKLLSLIFKLPCLRSKTVDIDVGDIISMLATSF